MIAAMLFPATSLSTVAIAQHLTSSGGAAARRDCERLRLIAPCVQVSGGCTRVALVVRSGLRRPTVTAQTGAAPRRGAQRLDHLRSGRRH